MIDLHFHCLPGIDDGPAEWDEAVALCRTAAEEGTETIVATPHVLRGSWINADPAVRNELLLKLNTRLGGRPAVLPGCEYFFSSDAVELWEKGSDGPLTGLNRSRYLLIEFSAATVPPNTESIFYELVLAGAVPVIAHPERNIEFARSPERLEHLVSRGALVQITAGSLLGHFGRGAERACAEFRRRGLVHLIASDAHSVQRRRPMLRAARELVAREWGPAAEAALFEHNPAAVIASEPLPELQLS
jgi:protein-tyrosine phosphatase